MRHVMGRFARKVDAQQEQTAAAGDLGAGAAAVAEEGAEAGPHLITKA